VRLLFVKELLAWPRSSGHDVHCYHMMRALTELGHEVSLITRVAPAAEAIAGLKLAFQRTFPPAGETGNGRRLHLSGLQERFRSYWGIHETHIKAVAQLAEECRADAVVVVGLNVLPYLGGVSKALRVWYAADEWTWHHLSQVNPRDRSSWSNLRDALVKGLYERAYAPLLSRIWVVTDKDRRAMRWVTGRQAVDVIPNGVDGAYFRPLAQSAAAHTCTFWGRLDFGPNIQGLEWFCRRVWPLVRGQVTDARFTIYGFNPTPPVARLAELDGIALVPNLPDLRAEVAKHQVVVLPFVSGGGIKNKLLEAASMGRSILCTPQACGGLRRAPARSGGEGTPGARVAVESTRPFLVAREPEEWARLLMILWNDALGRQRLGQQARAWVLAQHSWTAAARAAIAGLEQTARERCA
jgi:glycosyltransferase involved in cell wall biosynthesis